MLAPQVVPRNKAMDMGVVEEAAVVVHSCNGRDGPRQMTQACSLLTEHAGEDAGRRSSKEGN